MVIMAKIKLLAVMSITNAHKRLPKHTKNCPSMLRPMLRRIVWLFAANQQAITVRITKTRTVATGMYLANQIH